MRPIRPARWPKRRGLSCRAAACWCSTCASTTRNGSRHRLGDRWLGFADEALAKLLKGAGLTDVRVSVGARRTGDPFTVIVASGMKPEKASKSLSPQRTQSSQKN